MFKKLPQEPTNQEGGGGVRMRVSLALENISSFEALNLCNLFFLEPHDRQRRSTPVLGKL